MRDDFVQISHDDSIILEYTGCFNHLSRFAEQFVASEEHKPEHFQRRFHPEIRSVLVPFILITYNDVLEEAMRVEQ